MIKHLIVSSSLFFAVSVGAQIVQAPTVPTVKFTADSETKDLAQGYARAASLLKRLPVTLVFQKEGVVRMIEDVRSIRDSQGILVVEVAKGLTYLVNPKDVVYFTDGLGLEPKK